MANLNNSIIAIDGFSSCGKSTLAKQLASHLRFAYVDSGAMYRALTYHFLHNNVDLRDQDAVQNSISNASIEFSCVENENNIYLNGQDLSLEIRKMYISEKVSKVSPLATVRKAMVELQQAMGAKLDIVMDGRDIGTQVFPYATVKLFMTAEPKKRAERRFAELSLRNEDVSFDEIYTNLAQRDYDDTTREESPLVCAPDAVIIDNTELSMQEQFELALSIIQSKIPSQIPTLPTGK